MSDRYEQFINADKNRIAWVEIFKRFEPMICELEEYAPHVAVKRRQRFYEEAAQPLVTAERGEELLRWLESDLSDYAPLSWEEAVRCAQETGRSAFDVAAEHRAWALAQE